MNNKLFCATLVCGFWLPCSHAAQVLLPDGSPAAGAQAVSLQKTHFIHVLNDEFERPLAGDVVITSANGELEVTDETAGRWIVLHPKGWADVELTVEHDAVQLNPWLVVDGKLVGSHGPDARISYARMERPRRRDERGGSVYWTSRTDVNTDGSFRLTQLPGGPGIVGLFREVKSDRRISRWRDFPQQIQVPAPESITVGDSGVEVRGTITAPADELPALLTLLPEADHLPYHGLTDADGNFAIPGMIAGEYQLTARPSLGSGFRNPPTRTFTVADIPVDLGKINATEYPFELEVDRRVEITDAMLANLVAAARNQAPRPIEKIWVGELGHPTGNYGVRVMLQPAQNPSDPTRATRPMLIFKPPGEFVRKFYPEHDSLGHGFRFATGDVEPGKIVETEVRVFPLKNQTLFIPIEPDIDYETSLQLLRAIESNAIETPKPKSERTADGGWRSSISFGRHVSVDIFSTITRIRKQKEQIEIQTRDRPFGGRYYQFQKTDGGFLLTGASSWIS